MQEKSNTSAAYLTSSVFYIEKELIYTAVKHNVKIVFYIKNIYI